MATFHENQKLNCVSNLSALAKRTVELCNDMQMEIEKWQSFGLTPAQFIESGILSGTSFNGLTDTVLSNWVGSADNLANTWYATHGVNARLMTE